MRRLTYLQAIREAQWEEMARDERVILLGEDIRSNLFGTAGGFLEQFGPERVRNVPMSEAAFVGAGVGAAMTGLRPIVDMLLSSFMYVAMDQFVSQVAKTRYMFGGQADIPVVYRAAGGRRSGPPDVQRGQRDRRHRGRRGVRVLAGADQADHHTRREHPVQRCPRGRPVPDRGEDHRRGPLVERTARTTGPMMQAEVRLPQWGMGMREGTIVRWLKQTGDVVAEGDPLVEIEADKVTDVVCAPMLGALTEIRFPEDTTVAVRTVIAVIGPA